MNAMFGNTSLSSNNTTKLLVYGVVFFVLSMPFVDNFIKGKISASNIVILAIKTGIFLLILILTQLIW